MKDYLELIRIKHWLKNGLVFLPIFFNMSIFHIPSLLTVLLAFFVFSITSSMVYIINDESDIEADRKHPIKKNRVLASGRLSIKQANMVFVILTIIDCILMYMIYKQNNNVLVFVIPVVYFVMNVLYTKGLKNIPIIDVLILVIGFLLRIIYGGMVIDVEVSKYLYLMVMFASFFLGFGKRRNEIIKNGDKSRSVLEKYNKEFLDKNMYVSFALAIVSYTLWCVDETTINRIGNDYIFWTIPIVMIILQLYSLHIEEDSHGDPIEVILSDKKLIGAAILYIIAMGGILYLL